MADKNYMTPNGVERIRRELAFLQHEERPRIVAEVSYAASLGDRSENAEYIYGKKRLREIDRRMKYLLDRMRNVQMIDPASQSGPRVGFGATIVVEDEEGNARTWKIYGEDEVDVDAGVLSWKAPLSRAAFGKEEGDAVTFHAPGGMRELEILEVRYEPQEPLEPSKRA